MAYDKKEFFDQLDVEMKKAAKKNDQKEKEKKNRFFEQELDLGKKSKKKKDKKKDKNKKSKSDSKKKDKSKKNKDKEKEYTPNVPQGIGEGKLSKKILKEIRSKELREAFKNDKVLIDNKKFWTSE